MAVPDHKYPREGYLKACSRNYRSYSSAVAMKAASAGR